MPTSERNMSTAVRNMPTSVFNMPTSVNNMPTSVRNMPTSVFNMHTAVRNMSTSVFNIPTYVNNMPTSVAILACDNKVDEHTFAGVSRVLPQVIHVYVDLPEEKVQFKSRETITLRTQLVFIVM
jgi:hypothetical protein